MTLNTYRNNPDYPDRYSRNKGWRKILPIQGRPVQAAELTEIQSILQDNIKQGFDTLFRNGSPINGLRATIASRNFDNVQVSISDGQIYIEGTILDIVGTTLTIPTDDIYNIVVIVTETINTEEEDATLRDPIKGGFTLGTPGAARLIWSTSLAFNPTNTIINNSYAIAQVVNGVILQKDLNPFYEIERIISQFIYERSGNFCVTGLNTSSLGLNRRSASNVSRYEELQSAVQSSEADRQNALANLVTFQNLVNELTQQVSEAQVQASIAPTAQNNSTLASLQNQLSNASSQFSNFSNQLAVSQQSLDIANSTLNNAEDLLTDQQIISISPGTAYIEGYRVSINSPYRLFIPQSLPTSSVEAATFTFRGFVSQSLRSFSLSSGTTSLQTTEQYIQVVLDFNNIQTNPNVNPILNTRNINIRFILRLNDPTDINTIVSDIRNSLNSSSLDNNNITYEIFDNEASGTSSITLDANGNFLTKTIIKSILSQYIETTTPDISSLLFSATNFTLDATQININISSKVYLKADDSLVNNVSNVTVNLPSQTLSEPISNSTYQLGFRPVQKINRLIANLQATVTITRNENSLEDTLNEDSVVRILQVTQTIGNIVNTFSSANYITTQSGIQWRAGANNIPVNGTAYQVVFIYTEPLAENTDFILNTTTDTIEFIGRTPAINDIFTVDYSFSLSKAGVITIDKNGIINYALSAAAKNPTIPSVPDSQLPITSFILSSNNIELSQLDCRRQTVADLYDLSEKVRQNTINNQILKADISTLNNAVAEGNNPIGVFTDALVNLSKLDLRQTTASIIPGVQAFMANYFRNEQTSNYIASNTTATIINSQLGTPLYAILPYTEVKFFSQPRSTKIREIKTIPSSINKRGRLYVNTPYIFLTDESIDTYEGTTIPKTTTKLSPCDSITRAGNFFISNNDQSDLIQNITTNVRNILGPYATSIIQSFETGTPTILSNTNEEGNFLAKAYNDYRVRPIQIELKAEGLPAGINSFKVYINGEQWYNYTLRSGTPATIIGGVINGFGIKADGTAEIALTLPPQLPTGTHSIEIKKEGAGYCKTNIHCFNNLLTHLVLTPLKAWNATPITTSASEPKALIPADVFSEDLNLLGIDPSLNINVIDNTISFANTDETAFPNKHFTVNQTFIPNEDYFITRVDLKINSAPIGVENELNIFLLDTNQEIPLRQIRAATNSPITYNLTTLSNGNEGSYTSFNFPIPAYIKRQTRYSIGLESYLEPFSNSNFAVYSAVADDIDISTNSIIGEQLFIDGQLFTSPDGSSLNIEKKEDLTMDLYRANFINEAILDLGSYSTTGGINFFAYNTRDIIPIGTDLIYEYQVHGSTNWISFNPNTVICLALRAAGLNIRCTLLSNFKNLTPMVLIEGSSITMYNTSNLSTVISKQVVYPTPYTKITIILDYIKPAGTNIEIFYSPNDGFTYQGTEWLSISEVPNSTIILDPILQIYRTTYFLDEGDNNIYHFNFDERVKFRYRLDLEPSTIGVSPLIKNIQTYVE